MKPIDIAFSIDRTGSMYPAIPEVRRRLKEVVERLQRDIPNIRLAFIGHGDYCDKHHYEEFFMSLDFTKDREEITDFINRLTPAGGGDAPEAYEYALYEAEDLDWRDIAEKALVVIGDEVPHGISYPGNWLRLDWKERAKRLAAMGVRLYGVQALGNRHATLFYEELAKIGSGYKINLDQLSHIVETILAICYKQSGDENLQNYATELQKNGKLNRSIANMLATLSGKKYEVTKTGLELDAVPPYRFQVLNVDSRIAIQKFVENSGAKFRKGKGFYQFTKREEIQERKEVVLVDKRTGDMYSGSKARELIGLPYGERGNLSPVRLDDFDVFIQSTSNNRVLMPGTKFLYETE